MREGIRAGLPDYPLDELRRLQSCEIEQRSDEWFNKRLGVVTGSEFKKAIAGGGGKVKKRYMMELIAEELTGLATVGYTSYAMDRGSEMENEGKWWFEEQTGKKVLDVGFVLMDGHDWIGASPDGIMAEDRWVFELKCPLKPEIHLEYMLRGKCPAEYRAQVQGEIMVTGAAGALFVSYHPDFVAEENRMVVIEVERDDEYIEEMYEKLCEFREEMLNLLSELEKRRA